MFWKLGRELFSSLQWSWAAQQSDKVAFGHTDFFLLGQLSCNFNYFSKLVIQEEWNYAREWFTSFLLASISGNKHKEQIADKSQRRTILSYIKHVVCIISAINTGTRNRVYPEQPEITQVPGCSDVGLVWWYCWSSRQALSSSRKKWYCQNWEPDTKISCCCETSKPLQLSEQRVLFFFWWVMEAKASSGSLQHSWGWAKDQLWTQISWPQSPQHSMLPHLHTKPGVLTVLHSLASSTLLLATRRVTLKVPACKFVLLPSLQYKGYTTALTSGDVHAATSFC